MVEKFDSNRLCLKRPMGAKAGDAGLGSDPYRTSVGMSEWGVAFIILGCVFGGIAIMLTIIAVATR